MELKHSLAQIVKGNTAHLQYIKEGKAYYQINVEGTNTAYLFYVDMSNLEDVGKGRFELSQKASELMRWIRKCIDSEEIVEW